MSSAESKMQPLPYRQLTVEIPEDDTPFIDILPQTPKECPSWGWKWKHFPEKVCFMNNVVTFYCGYLYAIFAKTLFEQHGYNSFMCSRNTLLYRKFMDLAKSYETHEINARELRYEAIKQFKEVYTMFMGSKNWTRDIHEKVLCAWKFSIEFVRTESNGASFFEKQERAKLRG
jgi:hypothetical protein